MQMSGLCLVVRAHDFLHAPPMFSHALGEARQAWRVQVFRLCALNATRRAQQLQVLRCVPLAQRLGTTASFRPLGARAAAARA